MPLISSPIVYPPSSSPPEVMEPRKRPHPAEPAVSTKRRLFGKPFIVPNALSKIKSRTTAPRLGDASTAQKNPNRDDTLTIGPFLDEDGAAETTKSTNVPSSVRKEIIEEDTLEQSGDPNISGNTTVATSSKLSLSTNGKRHLLLKKTKQSPVSYERLVAQRSTTAPGKATTSYYGIDVHKLIDEAEKAPARIEVVPRTSSDTLLPTMEAPGSRKKNRTMMWTEKYRARKFTDLVGDERTHRTVLRWIKGWDPIVFPGSSKPKVKRKEPDEQNEERVHRKILLLTGPPGLGKTTLAHVCARQAGYEVVEINASDERSKEVVKGRIKDCVGTENVRGVNTKIGDESVRKAGRPVCVIVDEVDGVVGGSSGGGDGGFMKALIDLIQLDQKNMSPSASTMVSRKNKGDRFRLLRPMILICNDVYYPSLRPLRSSNLAEIVHIRKPPLDKVVIRLKHVFEKEGLATDSDGVRRLCEATWGITSRKEGRANSNTGEGDMRGVLVVGEWAAAKLRACALSTSGKLPCLSRHWVEKYMLSSLLSDGASTRGLGRGGPKEAVDRIFLEGAGYPKSTTLLKPSFSSEAQSSVSDLAKGNAITLLRTVIDSCGDTDRILTDVFATYPTKPFQDDTFLSKPNAAADWLHFHDTLSTRIFSGQEWELNPYMSQALLAFHYLFAGPATRHSWGGGDAKGTGFGAGAEEEEEEPSPFTGPRADYEAYEAQKANMAVLQSVQASLSIPLLQSFRSPEAVATDLAPYLHRMLAPDVKPVVVGGSGGNGGDQRATASVRRESEREMVRRAVEAMGAVGVAFERGKVEDGRGGYGGFVYRMEPPIDTLATYETASKGSGTTTAQPARYAVRQVLDQELQRFRLRQATAARQARFNAGASGSLDPAPSDGATVDSNGTPNRTTKPGAGVKRDFFGRVIVNEERVGSEGKKGGFGTGKQKAGGGGTGAGGKGRIWVSFHEGFSNAVRKPISMGELVGSL